MLEILQEFGLGDIKVEIKVDIHIMSNKELEIKAWSLHLKPCQWMINNGVRAGRENKRSKE